ncbi:MAG: hypothetical protein DDT27_00550 [Dehalococcoidia bacterium]|nr:hypothetical protein [Chloroflexota bacterium]MBT9159875.1 hypothetical protein [Chloroflexota bacterium]MBT9162007.1 hypothetical protein [Chloroflexota bacterium]
MSEATFLVRMDSGNDSLGNILVLAKAGKGIPRGESPLYHQAQSASGDARGVAGDSQRVAAGEHTLDRLALSGAESFKPEDLLKRLLQPIHYSLP